MIENPMYCKKGAKYPNKRILEHMAYRNGLTANEWVIQSQEKELKKKDEQISGWIEKYAENIVRIRDQQRIINELKEENEKLQKENNDYEKQFRIINDKIDEYIKTADTYRIPISSLKYGDELGYFNGVYQSMKKLKRDIGGIGYD